MPKSGFPTGDLRLFLDFPELRGIKILITSSSFYNWREQCSKRIWVKELRFESINSGYSPHILIFRFFVYFVLNWKWIWKRQKSSNWVSHDTRISNFWVENNLISAQILWNLTIFDWNSKYERKWSEFSIFFKNFIKNHVIFHQYFLTKIITNRDNFSQKKVVLIGTNLYPNC